MKTNRSAVRLTAQLDANDSLMVPVHAAFGSGTVHHAGAPGPWDVERIETTYGERVIRSERRLLPDEDGECHVSLLVEVAPGQFVTVKRGWANAYTTSAATSAALLKTFVESFLAQPQPEPASFQLIKYSCNYLSAESVVLKSQELQDEQSLAMYYGGDFPEWHDHIAGLFREHSNGISIFEGPPGTGKTSYIRQLMITLKDTHRFYFLPACSLAALRDSEFVDFWADERRLNAHRSLVVILEDAENALYQRHGENRQEVTVLLNITDGILGEFLRLQVICTVNCALSALDPALLRPGRLLARRHFGRIPSARAAQLAATFDITLVEEQSDYSLAEIFNGSVDSMPVKPPIGFSV